jgi:protein-tyrosine phosphatase
MTLDQQPESRHLPFERAFNVRDLGGYPTAGGGSVRWRTVYRADSLHRLSAQELHALDIRTVVDLRTPGELERRGRVDIEGIAFHHLSMLQAIWSRAEMDGLTDPADYLVGRYLAMLDEGAEAIVTTLELVADPANLPLAFHCAAGKDRTGVLAAILLEVVGVDDESIIHDYGLTGAGMVRFLAWLRQEEPERYDTMVDQPPAILAAPEEAMRTFLIEARRRHGSFVELARGLGVGDDTLGAVRANLVAPPAP